jgi:hypothetical protein
MSAWAATKRWHAIKDWKEVREETPGEDCSIQKGSTAKHLRQAPVPAGAPGAERPVRVN